MVRVDYHRVVIPRLIMEKKDHHRRSLEAVVEVFLRASDFIIKREMTVWLTALILSKRGNACKGGLPNKPRGEKRGRRVRIGFNTSDEYGSGGSEDVGYLLGWFDGLIGCRRHTGSYDLSANDSKQQCCLI